MEKNNYGDAVDLISVIPTVFSNEIFESLPYKERKIFSPKKKEAEFRLRIDYNKYVCSNDIEKSGLILDNIIQSIRLLNQKVKKDFDGEKLEKDIRELFNYFE
jgi:hypothetical protein